MASFSDYMKEIDKCKDDLINHIYGLRDNLNLRIEELKCMKDMLSDYDYLYVMVKLKVASEHLIDALDLLNGWNPEDEENIPADMVFEEGDPDEQDR